MTFIGMIIGGFLVWLGLVGGAIADRVRYGKARRRVTTEVGGRAARAVASRPDRVAVRERQEIATIPMLNDVRDALVGLGYKPAEASAAAAEARRQIGDGAPLDVWVRKALQVAMPAGKS